MEEIKQDDLREEWIKALENPLMFSRDVGNETFDWWISKILSQRQKDKDMLREKLQDMKLPFEETDPDNIQDKEAYYTNLTIKKIQDFLTK